MGGKIFLSLNFSEDTTPSPWRYFDVEWYAQHYDGIQEAMLAHGYQEDDYVRFYQEIGAGWGHSPNVFFDEIWFRSSLPEEKLETEEGRALSGFAFYCQKKGQEQSPHWLFDENLYTKRAFVSGGVNFQALGFENGWAHYLKNGEQEGLSPSPFFDLQLVGRLARLFPAYFKGRGLLEGWLNLPAKISDLYRVSWYFDPCFYLEYYPEAAQEIASGKYINALHRYLSLAPFKKDNPSSDFDEIYYREANPDIVPFIKRGNFRNGFDHFLRCGAREGRSPLKDVSLRAYGALPIVRSQCESGAWDSIFARFVAEKNGYAAESGFFSSEFSENQTKTYFRETAEEVSKNLLLTAFEGVKILDFSVREAPAVSVLIVAHNQVSLTLQTLLSLRKNYQGAMEVILVNSGSDDFIKEISILLKGVRIVHYEENIGYLRACNEAYKLAKAPKILLLNNDIRFFPKAVENALEIMEKEPLAGAICARLVRTHMMLQEAGSILWEDGSAYGYRREDEANVPEALFQREADYGSAAFLLLSRYWIDKAGETLFETLYLPAYFEDTDLCTRLRKAGAKVIYSPSCLVEHLEFGTSGNNDSHILIQMNLRKFIAQHREWLSERPTRSVLNASKSRDPSLFGKKGKERRQILFIEDYVPLHRLGSGYGRSADIIGEMATLGWQVTIFPIFKTTEPVWRFQDAFPETVEIMSECGLEDLAQFLEERAEIYDLVWVGRTHNWHRVQPFFKQQNLTIAALPVILDTEVIAAPRLLAYENLYKQNFGKSFSISEMRDVKNPRLLEELERELQVTHHCTEIVCVNAKDAKLAEEVAWPPVKILGHLMPHLDVGGSFESREGILFFGALHSEDSPNYDSLLWLTQEILPLLDEMNGGVPLPVTIAGFVAEGVDLRPLSGRKNLRFLGAVENPESLFNQHRVFVAPTRYAGGLPYKLHEAAARGLPIVATDMLAAQLGWKDGEELLAAPIGDSQRFAKLTLVLSQDSVLWEKLRQKSLEAVRQDCDVKKFQQALEDILKAALDEN
ncbi:glycosyltransferase [Acetobacteraceae bacterium]|nr:glycosyltransferase [Acetobacteraceae bacterium]